MIMMPYVWPTLSLQLTGHADFWRSTRLLACLLAAYAGT
jgi:hypothetical protein